MAQGSAIFGTSDMHSHCFRSELVHVNDMLRDARFVVEGVKLPPVEKHDSGAPRLGKQGLDDATTDLPRGPQNCGRELGHSSLLRNYVHAVVTGEHSSSRDVR